VDDSVLELYREDVARFRVILGATLDEEPLELLERGLTPELKALRLHNGTVYRWNRACYGVLDGRAHLRIENRVLPSGPSVVDEVANAAFWLGLMEAAPEEFGDVRARMSFADAKQNFVAAARLGLSAQFAWLDGRHVPAQTLVCEELLPLAREGLRRRGVDSGDVDRYLGVIYERVESSRTGSSWMLQSLDAMNGRRRPVDRLSALTAAMLERQKDGEPVARWPLASLEEAPDWRESYLRVEQYMTTDLFTVREDEPIDLVASLMEWKHIRHVPVEDNESRLVGIISYRALLRLVSGGSPCRGRAQVAAGEIMKRDPVSIPPETPTLEAIALMREHGVSALPVVQNGKLVGIVSERDFMEITGEILEQRLRE
jgi:CBS domain-containing protein